MNIEVKESRDKSGLTLATSAGVMGILLASASNELTAEAQGGGMAGELAALLLSDVEAAKATVKRLSTPKVSALETLREAAEPGKELPFVETLDQLASAEEVATIEAAARRQEASGAAGGAEEFDNPDHPDNLPAVSQEEDQEANRVTASAILGDADKYAPASEASGKKRVK